MMVEWAAIWRGEPGDQERGMKQKEKKRQVANMDYNSDSKTAGALLKIISNRMGSF